MEALTKKEWYVINWGGAAQIRDEEHNEIAIVSREDWDAKAIPTEQTTKTAHIFADAGTTANKCGLLPSELLAQRDELLEACKDSFRILTLSRTNDNLYQRNKLFTLINKIQGEQP